MERKISIIIMILLVLSLIANIALLIILSTKGNITGFSTKATDESANSGQQPVFENDVIEIKKAELNKCCSFINAQGKEDGCYVLKDYDCSYCSDYCE